MDKNNTRNYLCSIGECERPGYAKGVCSKHYQYKYRVGSDRRPNFEERFWAYVVKGAHEDDCWKWTGPKDGNGYGKVSTRAHPDFSRGSVEAHRVCLYLHGIDLIKGLVVDHICRNTECVNTRHLRQVDVAQNAENKSIYSRRAKSGYRGVTSRGSGWRAEVTHLGVRYDGGYYEDVEDAASAVLKLRLTLQTYNEEDIVHAKTNA